MEGEEDAGPAAPAPGQGDGGEQAGEARASDGARPDGVLKPDGEVKPDVLKPEEKPDGPPTPASSASLASADPTASRTGWLLSVVALCSAAELTDAVRVCVDGSSCSGWRGWAVACGGGSLIASTASAVLWHLNRLPFPARFLGPPLAVWWSVGALGLTVAGPFTAVTNGYLYSWGALCASALLFTVQLPESLKGLWEKVMRAAGGGGLVVAGCAGAVLALQASSDCANAERTDCSVAAAVAANATAAPSPAPAPCSCSTEMIVSIAAGAVGLIGCCVVAAAGPRPRKVPWVPSLVLTAWWVLSWAALSFPWGGTVDGVYAEAGNGLFALVAGVCGSLHRLANWRSAAVRQRRPPPVRSAAPLPLPSRHAAADPDAWAPTLRFRQQQLLSPLPWQTREEGCRRCGTPRSPSPQRRDISPEWPGHWATAQQHPRPPAPPTPPLRFPPPALPAVAEFGPVQHTGAHALVRMETEGRRMILCEEADSRSAARPPLRVPVSSRKSLDPLHTAELTAAVAALARETRVNSEHARGLAQELAARDEELERARQAEYLLRSRLQRLSPTAGFSAASHG